MKVYRKVLSVNELAVLADRSVREVDRDYYNLFKKVRAYRRLTWREAFMLSSGYGPVVKAAVMDRYDEMEVRFDRALQAERFNRPIRHIRDERMDLVELLDYDLCVDGTDNYRMHKPLEVLWWMG